MIPIKYNFMDIALDGSMIFLEVIFLKNFGEFLEGEKYDYLIINYEEGLVESIDKKVNFTTVFYNYK